MKLTHEQKQKIQNALDKAPSDYNREYLLSYSENNAADSFKTYMNDWNVSEEEAYTQSTIQTIEFYIDQRDAAQDVEIV